MKRKELSPEVRQAYVRAGLIVLIGVFFVVGVIAIGNGLTERSLFAETTASAPSKR